LGRRDSLTANRTLANQNLPAPFFNLTQLKAAFAVQGLDTTDLVALSGNKYSPIQIILCVATINATYNNNNNKTPIVDPSRIGLRSFK